LRNKTPRAICLEILGRMEGQGRHLDTLLTDSFKQYRHLSPLDRAFLTELTYGIVRWRKKLDWTIRHFSKFPLEKIEPGILNCLRLGSYQILFLTRTPVSAAVNESVELAKKTGGKGGASFVNAVLRSIAREKEKVPSPDVKADPALHLSIVESHPLWLTQRWVKEFGAEKALEICRFNNRISPLNLRTNTLKTSREDLMKKLRQEGLDPVPTFFAEEGIRLNTPPPTSELPFLKEGLCVIQDEASQLVTSVLDSRPGERILDACAAPGGKTTHMAQRMKNAGEIYALDLERTKLRRIEEGCRRLEISIVKTAQGDATGLLPVPEGIKFDRVLADVPCSGFGTLRKNPDLKWKRREEDLQRLAELQSSILGNVAGYVRKGGTVVYSTCTVFQEENEEVIKHFLDSHPEFQLDRIDGVLPQKCHPFIREEFLKTFPPAEEMDGFFVAGLVKK